MSIRKRGDRMDDSTKERLITMIKEGNTYRQIKTEIGVSSQTIANAKKKIAKEKEPEPKTIEVNDDITQESVPQPIPQPEPQPQPIPEPQPPGPDANNVGIGESNLETLFGNINLDSDSASESEIEEIVYSDVEEEIEKLKTQENPEVEPLDEEEVEELVELVYDGIHGIGGVLATGIRMRKDKFPRTNIDDLPNNIEKSKHLYERFIRKSLNKSGSRLNTVAQSVNRNPESCILFLSVYNIARSISYNDRNVYQEVLEKTGAEEVIRKFKK